MKPLEGIKILDFSQLHGAAYTTMLLADLGAEVIKVERPKTGDRLRELNPKKGDYSVYHAYLNRGKKSIAVDLKTEKGKDIIRKLVKEADAVVENFKYGTMERLGLGYDDLKKINPKLVYAVLTGYGRQGENKEKVCFDNNAQAYSGMLDMSGYFNSTPITMNAQLGNLYGGMHLALGIILAVIHVRKGGEGQMVEVAASDSLFSALEDGMVDCSLLGHKHIRNGNMSQAIAPYDTYETKDGYVSVGVSSRFQWEKFCHLMGMEDFLDDPRFSSNEKRGENYLSGGLRDRIESITRKMTKFEMEELMASGNIPCGAVCTVLEAIESEQIRHREMTLTVPDPVVGQVTMPGIPIKLTETPACVSKAAPLLGEDSKEVLAGAGFMQDEIAALLADGIIGA